MPVRRSWCSCWMSGSINMRAPCSWRLLEILGAAHVLMEEVESGRCRWCGRCLQQRAHGAIAAGLEGAGAFASRSSRSGEESPSRLRRKMPIALRKASPRGVCELPALGLQSTPKVARPIEKRALQNG